MTIVDTFEKHIAITHGPNPGTTLLDIELLSSIGAVRNEVLEELSKLVKPHDPNLLVAYRNRSHFAAPLADRLNIDCMIVEVDEARGLPDIRKGFLEEIRKNNNMDAHEPLRAVIVENLVASGDAAEALVTSLRAANVAVSQVTCLIEVPLGGREKLNGMGISVSSVVKKLSLAFVPGSTTDGVRPAPRPRAKGEVPAKGEAPII